MLLHRRCDRVAAGPRQTIRAAERCEQPFRANHAPFRVHIVECTYLYSKHNNEVTTVPTFLTWPLPLPRERSASGDGTNMKGLPVQQEKKIGKIALTQYGEEYGEGSTAALEICSQIALAAELASPIVSAAPCCSHVEASIEPLSRWSTSTQALRLRPQAGPSQTIGAWSPAVGDRSRVPIEMDCGRSCTFHAAQERARPEQAVVVVDLPPVSEAKVCECLRTIPGPLKVYTVR